MTDDEFLGQVAAQRLEGGFGHAEHVRLAWILVGRFGLGGAGDVMGRMLRRHAAANGTPNAYHETITWGFLLLVNARIAQDRADAASWDAFARAHPDLLQWPNPELHRWWSPELLASDAARHVVALPDRGAGGGSD